MANDNENDVTVERAWGIIRQAYYADIKDLALSIKGEYENGDIADRDSLIEHIDETVDGCARVIYTRSAQECLLISSNDGAGISEMGADGFDWKDGIPWSQLAYFAVHADVMEALDDLDLDVNADFETCDKHNRPHPEGEECPLCDNLEGETLTLTDGTKYEGRLQYDEDEDPVITVTKCGACGFEWNDALITSVTPAPSGRCPNETNHKKES